MFADPIAVKLADTDENHVRIGISPNEGRFFYENGADNQLVIIKQNSTKNRFRREFRIVREKDYSDPISGLASRIGASVYLVVDEPRAGFADSDLNDMANSLIEFFDDSAGEARFAKLLQGEY